MALDPNPWELPSEVATSKQFTEDEFLDAVMEFAKAFNHEIPIGFEITPIATPVIRYAVKQNNPSFYFDWEKQVSERIAEHRIQV